MDYSTFEQTLQDRIQEQLGADAGVLTAQVLKNNGETKRGISIYAGRQQTTPIIHTDSFYEKYLGGMDMEECAREIIRLQKEPGECGWEARRLGEMVWRWEAAKMHVYPFLLHAEWNRKLLERLVHTCFLDMAVCFQIHMTDNRGFSMTLRIPHELLKEWGIPREELLRQALSNMEGEGYHISSMAETMRGMLREMEFDMPEEWEDEEGFAVLTNRRRLYGAAGILNRKLLAGYAGRLEKNLFLLPSSLHEFIIVADDGNSDLQELNTMIQEVNRGQVAQEEQLGEYAYYYDREKDEIRIAE